MTEIDLRSLFDLVVEQGKRIAKLETGNEPIISTINEHDDRLDDHDEAIRSLKSVTESSNVWKQGISRQLDVQTKLLTELAERARRV